MSEMRDCNVDANTANQRAGRVARTRAGISVRVEREDAALIPKHDVEDVVEAVDPVDEILAAWRREGLDAEGEGADTLEKKIRDLEDTL